MVKTKKQLKKKKIKKYLHFNPEEHDIYNCSTELKGQLKIRDFTNG